MRTVTKVESPIPRMPRLMKVAAYARVSMETERLQHSLSAQISYYSELIQKHAGWQYVGVYADDGISGTKISRRDEFQRMVEDCEAGKIDIILTKSISRFARNTVDLLNTVRHLKELGISVRFEKENIDSLSEDGELMLTLLASFAQEEVRSISDNVKWGTIKRFQQGVPNGHMRVFGYEWLDGQLTIIPVEADIIRWMYQEYMKGASRIEIGRALNEKGIFTRQGKLWVDSNVKVVLTNITYTGNLLFQKEYTVDPITKKSRKNRGELPQFFVENTHEAIISMGEFQRVQAEFECRRDLGIFGNKALKLSVFSTKVICSICGHHFRRSGKRDSAGILHYSWTCQTKSMMGISACNSKSITESNLRRIIVEIMRQHSFDEATFCNKIKEILILADDNIRFRFLDGHELAATENSPGGSDWWTPEKKALWAEHNQCKEVNRPIKNTMYEFTGFIRCGQCGSNFRCNTKTLKDATRSRSWYCAASARVCDKISIKDATMKHLVADALGLDTYDNAAMDEQIEFATVLANSVTFHFRDGQKVERNFSYKQGTKWSAERRERQCQTLKTVESDAQPFSTEGDRSEKKWPKS